MSRSFTAASSQYASYTSSAPVTGEPLTLAAWIKPNAQSSAANREIVGQVKLSPSTIEYDIWLNTSGFPQAVGYDGTTGVFATGGTKVTAAVWQHVCGVFNSSSSRSIFLNGGNKVTDSTALTYTSTPDVISIGAFIGNGGQNQFFDGLIAEVAVWNVALTDSEVASLASGISPLLIRASNLKGYWVMAGTASPEPDTSGQGRSMTLFNSPTQGGTDPTIITAITYLEMPSTPSDTAWDAVASGFTPRSPANSTDPTPN